MRARVAGICAYGLGVLTLIVATQGNLLAVGPAPTPAPEIDGASISAALGVVAAGVLILRSRRRSK
jgi:MYXO-CTERM domain-containing protein